MLAGITTEDLINLKLKDTSKFETLNRIDIIQLLHMHTSVLCCSFFLNFSSIQSRAGCTPRPLRLHYYVH